MTGAEPCLPHQDEKALKLVKSELFLRAPDAVLEPDVLSVLRKYVREDGGKPKTAVEDLSDNFSGMYRNLCTQETHQRGEQS